MQIKHTDYFSKLNELSAMLLKDLYFFIIITVNTNDKQK